MSLLKKRIPTLVGLVVLATGIICGILIVRRSSFQTPTTTNEIIPSDVRITNISDTQFTASWITPSTISGKILYGKTGEALVTEGKDDRDQLSSEEGAYTTHHVTVKGLQPSTSYAFRIVSGPKQTLFDNQGTPYSVTTGPTLATTPPASAVYGTLVQPSSLPAEGALVYLSIPGAVPTSTLVTSSGNWTIPLSIARSSDLTSFVQYDPSATVLTVEGIGDKRLRSEATVTTANSAPVPQMILGQTHDFRTTANNTEALPSPVASILPTPNPATSSGQIAEITETPGQFNVEPLEGSGTTPLAAVVLLNPAKEGESIATQRPEFRGTGPTKTVLSIKVESEKPYTGNVSVEADGTWSWTPPANLAPGEHTITIAYIDDAGEEQTLKRNFLVDASSNLPSFESTPSASKKPSPSPSLKATSAASASARAAMPATDSGVPVSGVFGPTLLTLSLAFAIMVAGAILLLL